MSEKTFPLSKEQLEAVIAKYPTPFHIYDEKAIRNNIRSLQAAFSWGLLSTWMMFPTLSIWISMPVCQSVCPSATILVI